MFERNVRMRIGDRVVRFGYWFGERHFLSRRWGYFRRWPDRQSNFSLTIPGDPKALSKSEDVAWRVNWNIELFKVECPKYRVLLHFRNGWWIGPWSSVRTKYVAVRVGPGSTIWLGVDQAGQVLKPTLVPYATQRRVIGRDDHAQLNKQPRLITYI